MLLIEVSGYRTDAAVGKAASEAFKHTAGMAPAPRKAIVGTTALATAAGTTIGIELGKASMKNIKIEKEIDSSKLEGRNSPSDFDGGFIHSVLEESEIPLISMVNGLCYLNYIEFTLILTLFSLLFRKYLNRKLKRFILKNKYNRHVPYPETNKEVESINDENVSLNKAFNTLDKYTDYLIVFIFICLIWIKFINIYFSSNLAENIDSFVKVYNHIINNSFVCLLCSIKNEYIDPVPEKNNLCFGYGCGSGARPVPFRFTACIRVLPGTGPGFRFGCGSGALPVYRMHTFSTVKSKE